VAMSLGGHEFRRPKLISSRGESFDVRGPKLQCENVRPSGLLEQHIVRIHCHSRTTMRDSPTLLCTLQQSECLSPEGKQEDVVFGCGTNKCMRIVTYLIVM